jgi:hypothetical protein
MKSEFNASGTNKPNSIHPDTPYPIVPLKSTIGHSAILPPRRNTLFGFDMFGAGTTGGSPLLVAVYTTQSKSIPPFKETADAALGNGPDEGIITNPLEW